MSCLMYFFVDADVNVIFDIVTGFIGLVLNWATRYLVSFNVSGSFSSTWTLCVIILC